MKIRYLAFTAIAALAVAAPATAQYPGYDPYEEDRQFDSGMDQLQGRIDSALQRGSISTDEAAGLRAQLWQLRRLERDYSSGGMDSWEQHDLQSRLSNLWDQLRSVRGDSYGYGGDPYGYDRDGNGYDDRSNSDGDGYADWLDRNGDGYNDRYDRDNNGYDDRYDQDGDGYDDRGPSTANPLDPDFYNGLNDGNDQNDDEDSSDPADGSGYWDTSAASGTLHVGDRAPNTLSPVPPGLRNRYPDGSGVVYRYDKGVIYQIDGSGTVRWVGRLPTY